MGLCSRLMLAGQQSNFSITDTLVGLIGGVIALLLACFMDFSKFSHYAGQLYATFVVLLTGMLLLSPFVHHGRSTFAPYLLILFPLFFAGLVSRLKGKGVLGIIISEFSAAVVFVLGMLIPSISAVFIAGTSILIILTYAIWKNWFGQNKIISLLVVYIPIIFLAAAIFRLIYRTHRFAVLLNPFLDPTGEGYIGVTTRKILGSAHPLGNSAGNDWNRLLPNSNSQYLLTFMIQRVGWIALVVILLIFILFILHGIRLCKKQESQFERLFCISILASFGLQCVCFLANNLGLISVPEFPLPLISGKVSMILNFFLVGCLMSMFRNGCLVVDRMDSGKESSRFHYEDGKLIISLK